MPTDQRLTTKKPGPIRRLVLRCLALMIAAACGSAPPSMEFVEDTPSDLQELSLETWDRFISVFPEQMDCIGRVTVEGDWTLQGSRAYYLPEDARVVLDIPATAPHLSHSLIHELAHHIEHVCPGHVDMREGFLEAQGLPPDTPWFEGPSWEETPSEQYAEAVVRLVLSRPVMNYRIPITSEAVETVRQWGGGS